MQPYQMHPLFSGTSRSCVQLNLPYIIVALRCAFARQIICRLCPGIIRLRDCKSTGQAIGSA